MIGYSEDLVPFQEVSVPNNVTHFEIYGENLEALAEFYRDLFGWTIDQAPGVDYYMIKAAASNPTGVRGGLTLRPIPEPRSWVHYVSVESLDEMTERLQRLGGTVLRSKTAVPKMAWYAVVADPEGNIFALWQSDPQAFPPLLPEE
jgi:predicted enzyme related to lactoylglutathione lyase